MISKIKTDNTLLADLKVNGVTVPGFDPIIQNYDVVLPYGTTNMPSVAAITAGDGEAVTTQAAALPGSASVVVTGEGTRTYTLHFTVDPNPVIIPALKKSKEIVLPKVGRFLILHL